MRNPDRTILKSNLDVREDDGDIDIREKVTRGLKVLGADQASTLPYLLELLSVKDSGIDQIPMSPEARKERIVEALKRIVLLGSEMRPLIMAIEDLHWIDKSSEHAFKDLLDSIPGARVLLVFSYRPEFVHTWGGKSYHTQITVNRLSNRESLAMLVNLLGTENIASDMEELILKKTEGIPFFLEEFTRTLKDLKIIERKNDKYHLGKHIQDVTIPSTIQAVIMARVDSLPEGAKELIQIGAAIEREFSYELIKRATGLQEPELLSDLSILKDSELLYERGIYPQSTYIFKHALTQEVVYSSILARKKKKIHEKIGNVIEDMYKDNINEFYGVLADHYIGAENYEKGSEYSWLAGKKAEKTVSLRDAVSYAQKRVACIESLTQTEEVQKRLIDARTALGLYCININLHSEAKEAVASIIDLAEKSGYKKRLAQIYLILGTYEFAVKESFYNAFQNYKKAMKLSEEVRDIVSSVLGSSWLGIALSYNCEFEEARHYMEKAIEINAAANSLWGVAAMKSHLSTCVHSQQGKLKLAYMVSEEAVQIAEECGDLYPKAMAYTSHGLSCYRKGLLEEAKRNFSKGADLCEKTNIILWDISVHSFLGDIYFDIGEYQKAMDHYNKARWLGAQSRLLPSWENLNKIGIARTKVMQSEKDIDLELLYRYQRENKLKLVEGWMLRYMGEILLNIDNQHINEAEEWINKAVESDMRNGMKWNLGRDFALYAEFFKRKGDLTRTKENFGKAIEILTECGADGWVEIYEKELATLT